MGNLVVDGLETILDDDNEETFVEAYAIAEDGQLIEPDACREKPDSTRADGGVYRWRSTWTMLPESALVVKITCKRDGQAFFEKLQKPRVTSDRQFLVLDAVLETFGLSSPL
jgi:hypothetical protein